MRILGIDPGTVTMGYGAIESREDEITLIDLSFRQTLRGDVAKALYRFSSN